MDTILENTEADIYGILSNTPSLALANVIRADEGLTEADISKKLATLTGDTKIGLGIVVLQSEVDKVERNLPGPPLRVRAAVQVIEAVKFNRSANGTGIKASVAALRVLNALHHVRFGHRQLYAEKNPVEPLDGKAGYVSYLVTVFSEANGPGGTERVSPLEFGADVNGDLVISTATAGAQIYTTTDGSFPGPGNPAAAAYAGPIVIDDDQVIRAAAFLSPLLPSDISEVSINISDQTITLNGQPVTLGGGTVLL